MKTNVFANQKGGVGKSAIGCQLFYYLAQRKQRVLFLDLDHQRNSTAPIVKNGRAVVASFTASSILSGEAKAANLPEGDVVLVGGDDALSALERKPNDHNTYVNALKTFLAESAPRFDVCLIDTNPNPDIRYAAAMIVSDFVLSPIQLNQEAIDGIGGLLKHPRYGYLKIKQLLNQKLELIGILPNLVEGTPFQRGNFEQLATHYGKLLLCLDEKTQRFACIPTRTAIAEAQAQGLFLGEMKKTSARDAWRDIKPVFDAIAQRMQLNLEA